MQCQVPICENEIQGEGYTHALGDGQHAITICDECEEKFKNYLPDYEGDEFVWVPRIRTGKELCSICQVEEVFGEGNFDKCYSCAMAYGGQMYEEFVACLSPEQLVLFEAYSKAREDFTSMVMLD